VGHLVKSSPLTLVDPHWLARLTQALDHPPLRARLPLDLAFGGRVAARIGSIEPALAAQLCGAGLPLRRAAGGWCIEVSDEGAIGPALAAVAQWLRVHDLAAAWRDELLAVTDAEGHVVGAIERAAVRPLGIATHAAHLVLCAERGQHEQRGQRDHRDLYDDSDDGDGIWLQQRAFDKATDPGQWDTAVGGLVAAGESVLQALARETWEEAGLHSAHLQRLTPFSRITVRRPVAEGFMVEHIDMFEATIPAGLTPLNQDGEVERFECVGLTTLVGRLHADAFTLEAGLILATWLGHPRCRFTRNAAPSPPRR
jgi:8-oxo-dGTP pyrophosphatase MutT (NUDIX family)